jgi:hypothetical protein
LDLLREAGRRAGRLPRHEPAAGEGQAPPGGTGAERGAERGLTRAGRQRNPNPSG